MHNCDCHGKSHRDDSLTRVAPDIMNGDILPERPGQAVYLCAKGLRERERRHKKLERFRRATRRSAA